MDNQMLLEYLEYISKLERNDKVVNTLEASINLLNDTVPQEIKSSIYTAYGLANGWLEYRVKDYANETGLSRTAVRTQIRDLEERGIVSIVKKENVTFLVLNSSK